MKKITDLIASDNVTAIVAVFSILWGASFLWSWATKSKEASKTMTHEKP